jgi:TonB family protein
MEILSRLILTFVLNAVWQIPLLAGGAALGVWLLRRWPAQFHYRVWVSALVLSVLLPMWSLREPLRTRADKMAASPALTQADSAGPVLPRTPVTDALRPPTTATSLYEDFSGRPQPRTLAVVVPQPIARWVTLCYLLMFFWCGARLLLAWGKTRDLRRAACEHPLPERVRGIVARCRATLGVRRVSILVSSTLRCPVTVGTVRPAIILPEYLFQPAEEANLTAALAHEMAHVRRRDFASNLLLETLYLPVTFHPLAAWLKRAIEDAREMACDEVAAGFLVDSQTYARSLVSMATAMAQPVPRPRPDYSLGVFDGNNLEKRVMRILKRKPHSGRWSAALAIAVAGALLAVTGLAASMASVRPQEPNGAQAHGASTQGGGSIRGTIFDPSGARVPNAEVTVTNERTGSKLRAKTDQTGDFSFTSLGAGGYSVEVEKAGFAEFHQQKFSLGPGVKGPELSIVLKPGEVVENVEVTALAIPGAVKPDEPKRPQRIRVGGLVQATKLLHMEHPAYPEGARKRGVQGVVLLQAVISLKGEPLSLRLINSPDPELSHAATDAVKQWRYEPTLLNGDPIEVVTTIAVGFHLVQEQGSAKP